MTQEPLLITLDYVAYFMGFLALVLVPLTSQLRGFLDNEVRLIMLLFNGVPVLLEDSPRI